MGLDKDESDAVKSIFHTHVLLIERVGNEKTQHL